jgi:hypothetical protein
MSYKYYNPVPPVKEDSETTPVIGKSVPVLKEQILKLVKENPDKVAHVLSRWIDKKGKK